MTQDLIWCERGGTPGPVLILLHGLGANAAVWDGLKPILAERWHGGWIIPDLRGHGRSVHRTAYDFASYAADIASLVPQGAEVSIIGHSMGGVIALLLASNRFGARVKRVCASSMKVDWTEEDSARGAALANAPAKTFDSKCDAIDRYLRVSGLKALVPPDSLAALVGIRESQGMFHLAADPKINAIDKIDFPRVVREAKADLFLLCGERDPVAPPESMRRLGAEVSVLPDLGHNLHVEAPMAFWSAIEPIILGP